MGTTAQFGIEPQLEPDAGHLGNGWSEVRRDTATEGLHLLTQWCHGNQCTTGRHGFRERG